MCRGTKTTGKCNDFIFKNYWADCIWRIQNCPRNEHYCHGYNGDPCRHATLVNDRRKRDFCCSSDCCAADLTRRDKEIEDLTEQVRAVSASNIPDKAEEMRHLSRSISGFRSARNKAEESHCGDPRNQFQGCDDRRGIWQNP